MPRIGKNHIEKNLRKTDEEIRIIKRKIKRIKKILPDEVG